MEFICSKVLFNHKCLFSLLSLVSFCALLNYAKLLVSGGVCMEIDQLCLILDIFP